MIVPEEVKKWKWEEGRGREKRLFTSTVLCANSVFLFVAAAVWFLFGRPYRPSFIVGAVMVSFIIAAATLQLNLMILLRLHWPEIHFC